MSSPTPHDPLHSLLVNWRVNPAPNPSFRASVWGRIEAAGRASNWTGFARAHPAAVSGLLAAAVLLGALGGRNEARQHSEADRMAIAGSYVHSLDARWIRNP